MPAAPLAFYTSLTAPPGAEPSPRGASRCGPAAFPPPPPNSSPRGTKWPREGPAARPPPAAAILCAAPGAAPPRQRARARPLHLGGLPSGCRSGAGRPGAGGRPPGAADGERSQACCRHCAAVARCSGAYRSADRRKLVKGAASCCLHLYLSTSTVWRLQGESLEIRRRAPVRDITSAAP